MRKFNQAPRQFLVPVKTHKLTLLTTAKPTDTITVLKHQVFEAISQFQTADPTFMSDDEIPEERIPKLNSVDDFELCRAIRHQRVLTGEYKTLSTLEPLSTISENWESLYVRFYDNESGELKPVQVTLPSLLPDDDEEEEEASMPPPDIEAMDDDSNPSLKRKRP